MSHSTDVRIWFTASTGERYEVKGTGPDYFYCDAPPPVGTEGVLTMTVDGKQSEWPLIVVGVEGDVVRTGA